MLAIIIPYFKLIFFEQTLQSLANQIDQRFKIYIGDDASDENPLPLLEDYTGKFDYVYHRFETNLGKVSLVKQWNRCIGLSANEEWIMILGDDDELGPACVADFYLNLPHIIANNCHVIRFATVVSYEQLQYKSKVFKHPQLENAVNFFFRKIEDTTRSSLSEYIFDRKSFDKFGFADYNLAWHADDRAWLEFSADNPIFTINSSIVNFRLSSVNISRSDFKIMEKLEASFSFFRFVFRKYFKTFTRNQKELFLIEYEQLIYKNKKATFQLWSVLFYSFLANRQLWQSVKFSRRFLIHFKNNAS